MVRVGDEHRRDDELREVGCHFGGIDTGTRTAHNAAMPTDITGMDVVGDSQFLHPKYVLFRGGAIRRSRQ
ncbi:hypothetical protein C8039_12930 [Halogeometricum sp. wsp3]|nr:hypothetical protein C8039_12930 [Halogeometricum sp. wsp3]